MTARRTQIYLDEGLRARVDRARVREGRSLAAIVRDALDRYLADDQIARNPLGRRPPPDWVGAWAGTESTPEGVREQLQRRADRLAS